MRMRMSQVKKYFELVGLKIKLHIILLAGMILIFALIDALIAYMTISYANGDFSEYVEGYDDIFIIVGVVFVRLCSQYQINALRNSALSMIMQRNFEICNSEFVKIENDFKMADLIWLASSEIREVYITGVRYGALIILSIIDSLYPLVVSIALLYLICLTSPFLLIILIATFIMLTYLSHKEKYRFSRITERLLDSGADYSAKINKYFTQKSEVNELNKSFENYKYSYIYRRMLTTKYELQISVLFCLVLGILGGLDAAKLNILTVGYLVAFLFASKRAMSSIVDAYAMVPLALYFYEFINRTEINDDRMQLEVKETIINSDGVIILNFLNYSGIFEENSKRMISKNFFEDRVEFKNILLSPSKMVPDSFDSSCKSVFEVKIKMKNEDNR